MEKYYRRYIAFKKFKMFKSAVVAMQCRTRERTAKALLFDLKRQDGASLLLVTHDRALASRCDRVAEVLDGKIVSGAHS